MEHEVVGNLIELLVILVAAKVGAELLTRSRQPAVIGELVIGMLVGPSLLGWVRPEGMIITLAEIGVILLLFEVGLGTKLREFARIGPVAFMVAVIGVVTPFVLGYLASMALGLGGGDPGVAIFVGAAMTATSVGITARVFNDLRQLDSDEAKTIIGAAVIDDILGLLILAVVVGLLESEGGLDQRALVAITLKALVFLVAAVAIGLVVAPYFFRYLARLRVEGSYVVGAFVFAIVISVAAEVLAGLAPIVGAFAAGMVAAEAPNSDRIARELRPIAFLFIPIFFLSIGAQVDVGVLIEPVVLVAGGVISLVAAAGKLVAGLGAWGRPVDRWVIGVGMMPRGEVGLIFAAIGLREALVGEVEHAIVVMMVVVTTLVAPLILNLLLRRRPPAAAGPMEARSLLEKVEAATSQGPELDEHGED
ncbi:MAG: cation:proton antiporter [Actinomycetota bacterium]|nr:cation:proton antiporter [Actinomycetota bacterium]